MMKNIQFFAIVLMALLTYAFLHLKEMRHARHALDSYYDQDTEDFLRWMEHCVVTMASFSVLVPWLIFTSGWLLAVFGLLVLVAVFYLVVNFVCYFVSNDASKVMEVEECSEEIAKEEKSKPFMATDDHHRVAEAVGRWIEGGGHLRNGITLQTVADEMKIPRYKLSAWLKTTDQGLFSPWITHLHIEEAKRMMTAHPEWSNEVIAEQCGFGSRSYFQTVFRKQMGKTPLEFMEGKR